MTIREVGILWTFMRQFTYPQGQKALLYSGESNAGRWRRQSTPLSHAWGGCLITNILEEAWPEDWITEAMVLSWGEAILFFGRCSMNEGLPYHRARKIEFGLGGPFNWAGKPTQIEALRKPMQQSHCDIIEAVVEKKMKASVQGQPHGKARHPRTPAVTYDIEEWMWGLEGASDGANWQSVHLQQGNQSWRSHRCQRTPRVPREPSGGSPSLGGDSLEGQSEQSLWHSNQTKVSQKSGQSGWTGRDFRVKVNLPTFEDEKAKDTLTYCSWHWDVSVFHNSGWDDWHFVPYVFRSLQGFLGDLARSLDKDATLGDVLQTLDECYGVVMTFNTLSKVFYSLKRGMGENVAEFRVHLPQQVQILQRFLAESNRSMWRRWSGITSRKVSALSISKCWPTSLDGENPATYFELLLAAQKLERWVEARYPLLPKTTTTGSSNITCSHSQGNLFQSRKLKGNHTFTAWSTVVVDHKTEEDTGPKPKTQ